MGVQAALRAGLSVSEEGSGEGGVGGTKIEIKLIAPPLYVSHKLPFMDV